MANELGLNFLPLSPATRRRQRGRGTIVLDEVTASNVTNGGGMLLPPDVTAYLNGAAAPSPDEMVIQSRGKRQVPITFSPDVHHTPLRHRPKQLSTLVRGSPGSRLLLPTRTSPRKRLTLTDSPDKATDMAMTLMAVTPSPDKVKRSPVSKRFRAQQPSSTTDPEVALKGLTHAQLTDLIGKLISTHPELRNEVECLMPAPDLEPLEERLNYLKRNIFRALPNTRLESKTDSLAYNRVATHLGAFKKAVLDQGKTLVEANQWTAVVDYSIMAWNYVKATPIWDNPPHNNVRKQCFKTLSGYCMTALKRGFWEADACAKLKERFEPLQGESEEILPCIKHVEHIINNGNVEM